MSRFRNPTSGLPHWWVETTVLISLYYVYTASRGAADASEAEALAMGWDILRLQEAFSLDIELSLNRWLQSLPVLAVICCYYYATLHFVLTPGLLIWMHRRRSGSYLQARWTLVFTTVISLAGFFAFPTAPPRLLPNTAYVDTMAYFEQWGWWSGGASAAPDGLEALANQYAAMPSLHSAWSLWCGFLLVRFGRGTVIRVIGVLYPGATMFVVMATSNHYILDVFAGWAVLGVSAALAVALVAAGARRRVGRTAVVTAADLTVAVPSPGTPAVAGPQVSASGSPAPSTGSATTPSPAIAGERAAGQLGGAP